MAWLELHQSAVTHRKTLALADALDIEPVQALGHMASMWLWALDNAPDGSLKAVTDRTLARAAQWTGDPAAFRAALVSAELLEKHGALHDWDDYVGKLIDQRSANTRRQREWRQRKTVTSQSPEQPTNGYVTVTSPLRNAATVPNRTVQNSTEPREDEGNKPPIPEPLLKAQDVLVPFVTRGFIPDRDNLLKVGTSYPNLDLDLEFRKLADWLRDPKNRKEQCSWRRIFNWLKRAEEYRQSHAHKNGAIEYPPPPVTEPLNGDLSQVFANARRTLALGSTA